VRQVPKILIIGRGKLATHLKQYLKTLDIVTHTWHRGADLDLNKEIRWADQVFLAISDNAIESFYLNNPNLKNTTCVHFSGALYYPDILGIHPLQTFGENFYEPHEYENIPFVIDFSVEIFKQNFFYLKNPRHEILPTQKPFYHALCVACGNFPQLLWHASGKHFEKLSLPKEILAPYLHKCVDNFCKQDNYLTGPIVRGDNITIQKNLKSLSTQAADLEQIYNTFYQVYKNKELK